MKELALNNSNEKRKVQNEMLSLYITIGANAIKLFNESGSDAARKVIEDAAKNTKSLLKQAKLINLLEGYHV